MSEVPLQTWRGSPLMVVQPLDEVNPLVLREIQEKEEEMPGLRGYLFHMKTPTP